MRRNMKHTTTITTFYFSLMGLFPFCANSVRIFPVLCLEEKIDLSVQEQYTVGACIITLTLVWI